VAYKLKPLKVVAKTNNSLALKNLFLVQTIVAFFLLIILRDFNLIGVNLF